MKKHISLLLFVIFTAVLVVTVFIPRVAEELFENRLSDSFEGGMTIDSITGAEFSYFNGFSVDYIRLNITSGNGSFSAVLKDVALGVDAFSISNRSQPVVLRSLSADNITVEREGEKGNSERNSGVEMLRNSLQGISFTNSFTLDCSNLYWSTVKDTFHFSSFLFKRLSERDFSISINESVVGKKVKSGFVQFDVFNVGDGECDSLFLAQVDFKSIFPRSKAILEKTKAIDTLIAAVKPSDFESRVELGTDVINKLYKRVSSLCTFDSLRIQNSLSTIRRDSSTLVELTWWSLFWQKDELGDSLKVSLPRIRDQKYGNLDSLETSFRINKGTLPFAELQFDRDFYRSKIRCELPQRLDSGRVDLYVKRNGVSSIFQSGKAPVEVDLVRSSLHGDWRKMGGWDLFVSGQFRDVSLEKLQLKEQYISNEIVLDSVKLKSLKFSSDELRLNINRVVGAIDTLPFASSGVVYNWAKEEFRFRKLELPSLQLDTLTSAAIMTGVVLEGSDSGFFVSVDTLSLKVDQTRNGFINSNSEKLSRSLWAKIRSTPYYSKVSTLKCGEAKLLGSREELSSASDLVITVGDTLRIQSSHVGVAGVGVAKKVDVTAQDRNGIVALSGGRIGKLYFGGDRSGVIDTLPQSVESLIRKHAVFVNHGCSLDIGHLTIPGILTRGNSISLKSSEWGKSLRISLRAKSVNIHKHGAVRNIYADGILSRNRLSLDTAAALHKGVYGSAQGWLRFSPEYPCSLKVKAVNVKLSKVSQKLLQGHGTVTGAGALSLTFTGDLREPLSWEGKGAFTLRNVNIKNLSVQNGEMIDKYAAPFKKITLSKVQCNPFVLSKGMKAHLKNVTGSGDLLNFTGWGSLNKKGYFYFEMDGKVHSSTMEELPKLTRMALNENSKDEEGSFKVKLFGSPENQQLVPERGLSGKVIRSQFRNIGASFRKIFE